MDVEYYWDVMACSTLGFLQIPHLRQHAWRVHRGAFVIPITCDGILKLLSPSFHFDGTSTYHDRSFSALDAHIAIASE